MDYPIGSLLKRTITHRVAHKFIARDMVDWTEDDFIPTLGEAQAIHRRLRAWITKFPGVLARAEIESRGIPDGWVWQLRLKDYWQSYEKYRIELEELDHILDGIALTYPHLEQAATLAREATFDPPKEARLIHAFSAMEFFPHYRTGKEHIAYNVERLKEWAEAFGSWVVRSTRTLEQQKQAHLV